MLDSLRNVLRHIDVELKAGKIREKGVLDELDAATRRISLLEHVIRNQRRASKALDDSIAAVEAEILEQEEKLVVYAQRLLELEDEQRKMSRVLARSLLAGHHASRWASLEFLLGAATWQDFLARRTHLLRIGTLIRRQMDALSAIAETLKTAEDAEFVLAATLRDQREILARRRQSAASLELSLQQNLDDLAAEKRGLRKTLSTLQKDRRLLDERRREVLAAFRQIENMVRSFPDAPVSPGGLFGSLKGLLPWPLVGRVTAQFGLVRNPETATVTENPGIDITSSSDTSVVAVADGRVSGVAWLRGFGNVCIVEHAGGFHTVYARLGQVSVQKDDEVKAGTPLGYPAFDPVTAAYRMHFELWAGKVKQNPIEWLRRP